jgi:hypothetical protein
VIWRDYDPNWRQFIGCLLGVLLRDFEEALGPARCERAKAAVAGAIRGEPPERIAASYSNIALMQAWVTVRVRRACARRAPGHRTVERLYSDDGGFSEFNSPDRTTVSTFGDWPCGSAPAPRCSLRPGGASRPALWSDVAMFYHPGMRNCADPTIAHTEWT